MHMARWVIRYLLGFCQAFFSEFFVIVEFSFSRLCNWYMHFSTMIASFIQMYLALGILMLCQLLIDGILFCILYLLHHRPGQVYRQWMLLLQCQPGVFSLKLSSPCVCLIRHQRCCISHQVRDLMCELLCYYFWNSAEILSIGNWARHKTAHKSRTDTQLIWNAVSLMN